MIWKDRTRACETVDWTCLGEAGGTPLRDLGIDSNGEFLVGLPPQSEASGLLLIGNAIAGYVGTTDYGITDFAADDNFQPWFRGIRSGPADSNPLRRMLTEGRAAYSAVGTTEAAATRISAQRTRWTSSTLRWWPWCGWCWCRSRAQAEGTSSGLADRARWKRRSLPPGSPCLLPGRKACRPRRTGGAPWPVDGSRSRSVDRGRRRGLQPPRRRGDRRRHRLRGRPRRLHRRRHLGVAREDRPRHRAGPRLQRAPTAEVDGDCVFVRPQRKSSGGAEQALDRGWDETVDGPRPVVWSPAASTWGKVLNQRLADQGEPPMAGRRRAVHAHAARHRHARADGRGPRLPRRTPSGWADILELARNQQGWAAFGHPEWGPFRLGKTNPNFSTSGLVRARSPRPTPPPARPRACRRGPRQARR